MPLMTAVRPKPPLEDFGLGWLEALRGARLHHTNRITEVCGQAFYDRLMDRMDASHVYERWLCDLLMDDAMAYWMARCWLPSQNEPLVITLLPDMAWHHIQLYDPERMAIQHAMTGRGGIKGLLIHNPSEDAAIVNDPAVIAKTTRLMDRHGIAYHDLLWQDHIRFPDGALPIQTGVRVP